jgi:hypothetical protein
MSNILNVLQLFIIFFLDRIKTNKKAQGLDTPENKAGVLRRNQMADQAFIKPDTISTESNPF